MIHFRSNIQTAEFGLYQMYKHSASPRVTDWNPTRSRRGTSINCKVHGATCVDNTVFFTFIIKVVDIA